MPCELTLSYTARISPTTFQKDRSEAPQSVANRGLSILQGTGPYRLFQDIKRFIFLFTLGLKKQWKQREMSCCGQNEKHPGSSPVYYGQKTENFKRITGTSKFISLTVDTGFFITLSIRSPPKKNSLLGP